MSGTVAPAETLPIGPIIDVLDELVARPRRLSHIPLTRTFGTLWLGLLLERGGLVVIGRIPVRAPNGAPRAWQQRADYERPGKLRPETLARIIAQDFAPKLLLRRALEDFHTKSDDRPLQA